MNTSRCRSFPRFLALAAVATACLAHLAPAQAPVLPQIPGPGCPGDLVKNGGFFSGLVAGDLDAGGKLSNWSRLSATPQVVANEGDLANGSVLMWGNQVVGESIKQQVGGGGFVYGTTYEISFSYRWRGSGTVNPQNVAIQLCASTAEPTLYPGSGAGAGYSQICLTPLTTSTSWTRHTMAWYANLTGSWLTINPENAFAINNGNYVSWGEVDDICIRPISVCPNNKVANGDFTQGLVTGDLGFGGNATSWSALTATPQVIASGPNTAGAIQMWGNQVVGESIKQAVPGGGFLGGRTYRVSFLYAWLNNNPALPQYVELQLRAHTANPTTYPASLGSLVLSSGSTSATFWKVASAIWTPPAGSTFPFLTVHPQNDFALSNGNYVSWGLVDDICIQDITNPAVVAPFGTGCGLALDASLPLLGTTMDLTTSGIPAIAPLGLRILDTIALPFAVDLTPLGMPSCSLYTNLTAVDVFPITGATTTTAMPIPNATALIGADLFAQTAALGNGLNAFGAVLSNAVHLRIGDS